MAHALTVDQTGYRVDYLANNYTDRGGEIDGNRTLTLVPLLTHLDSSWSASLLFFQKCLSTYGCRRNEHLSWS